MSMKFETPQEADEFINKEFKKILPKVSDNINFAPIIDGMKVAYSNELDAWIQEIYERYKDRNILFAGVKLKKGMEGFEGDRDLIAIHQQYLKIALLSAYKNKRLKWQLRER